MSRFSEAVIWREQKGPSKEVCRFCMHLIKKSEVIGQLPFIDEVAQHVMVTWHLECRIEWLRLLASDAMSEADSLDLTLQSTNPTKRQE